MTTKSNVIFKDKSGYTYNRETGETLNPEGNFVGSAIPKTMSDKMIKLEIQATIARQSGDIEKVKKINKKINALQIAESPFLYSTPEYCYSYVLYKLRKVADYNQEEMAFILGMPSSTYIKIENRILKPSLLNIIMARNVFNLTVIEFAELYTLIEDFVKFRGKLSIYNETNEADSYTPIDLYDSKMLKEEYDYIDTKFREIYLVGKKRRIEFEQKEKEAEEKILQAQQDYEKLSWEEKQDIELANQVEQYKQKDERIKKQEDLLEALKKFHGKKYSYSL